MFNNPEEKITPLYLDQISNNSSEKYGDLESLIKEDGLPKIGGKVKILELGTGGGQTIKELKNQLNGKENVDIIGLDKVSLFASQYQREVNSPAVVADAGMLPFQNKSLSAINASSIFHEIYTYGVNKSKNKVIRGKGAVEKVLAEINRTLAPNGVLMYRDVACPENYSEIKKVNYSRNSWVEFIKKYLPRLTEALKGVDSKNVENIKSEEDNSGTTITSAIKIHREIQRHYLTFRDFFRKKMAKDMGAKVLSESWEDKIEGIKSHSLELTAGALRIYLDNHISSDVQQNKKFIISMFSDEYDDFTDKLIEQTMKGQSKNISEEWFKREGSEIYTYASPSELTETTSAIIDRSKFGGEDYCLEAESVKMIPRYYYQRYLNRVIDNPEFEGKQSIKFVKSEKRK